VSFEASPTVEFDLTSVQPLRFMAPRERMAFAAAFGAVGALLIYGGLEAILAIRGFASETSVTMIVAGLTALVVAALCFAVSVVYARTTLKRSPSRLILGPSGIRLSDSKSDIVTLDWSNPGFEVILFTRKVPGSEGTTRWGLRFPRSGAIPITSGAYNAIRDRVASPASPVALKDIRSIFGVHRSVIRSRAETRN